MTLSAILLAGGLSRRMGVDKATLPIAGELLWQRQLRLLNEMKPMALWVSARSELTWCPPGIEVVVDQIPSRGPLSGVVEGLRLLRTSHLLVVAIDLPQMTAEHLRKLWGLAGQGVGVIPQNGDYLEPLCAIYPVEAAAIAGAALNSNDVSLQSFAQALLQQSKLQTYSIAPGERALYLNLNTPADLPRSASRSTI